jgi:hypothetical protein
MDVSSVSVIARSRRRRSNLDPRARREIASARFACLAMTDGLLREIASLRSQ